MKKLVIKTALITLAGIIAITACFYLILALASPKTLAKFYDNAGFYGASIKYYEKQYKKTNEYSDLYILCTKVDEKNDSERAILYLDEMIESDEFIYFSTYIDENTQNSFLTKDFICGKYACALYYNNGVTGAINYSKNYIFTEYYENNPLSVFIAECGENINGVDKIVVSKYLEGLKSNENYSQQDLDRVNLDINAFN